MKIIVLIKQVPDVSQLEFDRNTRTLKREGVRLEVSSFDVRALVRAVELREEHGGEVVALTMGPPQAREALVHCLALGADRAIHLVDRAFAGADTLATARALAGAIRKETFDLILCGKSSVDAETGQVGPEVAEMLDCVQMTAARNLTVDSHRSRLRAERELDAGYETVECALPALVSGAEDIGPERFARRKDREAAAGKPIVEWTAADIADDPSGFGAAGSPTRVEAIRELEVKRECRVIEGEPSDAVRELVGLLRDRGALSLDPLGDGDAPAARPASDVRPGNDFWVVAEASGGVLRPVTFELLGKAATLAAAGGGRVVAALMGYEIRDLARELARYADEVLVVDDPVLVDYSTDAYAALLSNAIRERDPRSVLIPSTWRGRDLAPRVAARLGLGLTGDCIDLDLDDEGRLVQWKPAFGGTVVAPILSSTRPEMATVRPGMLPQGKPADSAFGTMSEMRVTSLPPIRTLVVDRSAPENEGGPGDLDEAPAVIGVGKGLGGPENLRELQPLAEALGNAPIATTRDVTDEGWLPRQLQVGLTGRAIAPRLYVAIGIRGAFEHLVGIRRAGTIVAVNPKAKAPVFGQCDFGIVGEWQTIVPLLVEELRKPAA